MVSYREGIVPVSIVSGSLADTQQDVESTAACGLPAFETQQNGLGRMMAGGQVSDRDPGQERVCTLCLSQPENHSCSGHVYLICEAKTQTVSVEERTG
jgi:hypothetical protein